MRGLEAIERRVESRLAAAVPDVDLLELTLAGGREAGMLRLVVDHPEGVDHDLCVAVTRALEEDGLLDEYGVEVWSPGPEPPLRTPEHFRRAVGRRVRVR
ncbi:MAG: ribosome maturation factor RimP, partial [Thermoleophilia bacterium]|nr:ribosome maturation factor RimP [Thermoleophilia bacterium]